MVESNIYFAPNTYKWKAGQGFNQRVGDTEFFRQVKDYDALKKLRYSSQMGGSFTSKYYIATAEQIHILDPNFEGVMVGSREEDPVIKAENKRNDAIYGYSLDNDYAELVDEIIIDENEHITKADYIAGDWVKNIVGDEEETYNPVGLFIKKQLQRISNASFKDPSELGIEDIIDNDPYYYIYSQMLSKSNDDYDIDSDTKVEVYEKKYGSMFNAFEEVEQKDIIEAPVEQKSFVNAGPGTGKTYTLIKKLSYMMDVLEVDPEEILILCFTNAAVNEIRTRLEKRAEENDDYNFLSIESRTFHSFSWMLISQANELFIDRDDYEYIDLADLDYDTSLRKATSIIKKYGEEVFGGVSHFIVDEVQDLTNERAELIISMIEECIKYNVGFTVFGDSCQAIYDYDEEENKCRIKSTYFYRQIFARMMDLDCRKFYKLEKNHRQSEELINRTSPLRKAVLAENPSLIRNEISTLNNTISSLSGRSITTNSLSSLLLKELVKNGTVCLMCRNNAQVLETSSNLYKRGINHVVNAYNEFEYLSDWIGKIFLGFENQVITEEEFKERIKLFRDFNDSEVIWKKLQEHIGSNNNILKVEEILKAIGKSDVDDPCFRNLPTEKLLVSNIHKAKGREYDMVILEKKFVKKMLGNSKNFKDDEEYIEEAKMLYVAVTRARSNLFFNSLSSPNVSFKIIKETGRKRWIRGDGNNLVTIEIRAMTDANIESFDDKQTQKYISHKVKIGDEISLIYDKKNNVYRIVHESNGIETNIGCCSKELIKDIELIITPYESPWPIRIGNLFVSGVHSEISKDYTHAWCWVDFCGLGKAENNAY